jgi:hypothetical protein
MTSYWKSAYTGGKGMSGARSYLYSGLQ